MGLRFFRRVRIAPGVWINLSKSGASLSLGTRGAPQQPEPPRLSRRSGLMIRSN